MTRVDRGLFLSLARRGVRFPIATDLALHEHPDPETARRDPALLGQVIARSAQAWACPLAIPLMDLRLEKADLLSALGVPEGQAESFHFTERPPAELPPRLFLPAHAAAIGAIGWIRGHTALVPCGMSIGPFSLMTRLLADPITPLALLARYVGVYGVGFASAALAAAQGVQTASVAQAAMAHGAQGAAIGQAVAKARAQAVQGWMDEAAAAR